MATDQFDSLEEADDEEREEGARRSAPSGRVVYSAIFKEGREELSRTSSSLFFSGLAAGLSMGFSLIAEALLRAHVPEAEWRPLVTKLGYSVGFLIVILGRQQLFTENTLTPVLPLLHRRDPTTAGNVLRLWGVVLFANLLGGLAIAWLVAGTDALELNARRHVVAIGREALAADTWSLLLRAVLAGWLIALMVWLLPFAEASRIWVIIIITWLIGVGHFAHVVAGSIQVFALAAAGEATWSAVIGGYLLPSLAGNVVGGVTLVAALNHAQMVAGVHGRDL